MGLIRKIFASSLESDSNKYSFVNKSDIILSIMFIGAFGIATGIAPYSVATLVLGIASLTNMVATAVCSALASEDMFISPLFRPFSVLAYKISKMFRKERDEEAEAVVAPVVLPRKKFSRKKKLSKGKAKEPIQKTIELEHKELNEMQDVQDELIR